MRFLKDWPNVNFSHKQIESKGVNVRNAEFRPSVLQNVAFPPI